MFLKHVVVKSKYFKERRLTFFGLSTTLKFKQSRSDLCGIFHSRNKIPYANFTADTVEPLFTYSIGQRWLYLLRKVIKSRYGFP